MPFLFIIFVLPLLLRADGCRLDKMITKGGAHSELLWDWRVVGMEIWCREPPIRAPMAQPLVRVCRFCILATTPCPTRCGILADTLGIFGRLSPSPLVLNTWRLPNKKVLASEMRAKEWREKRRKTQGVFSVYKYPLRRVERQSVSMGLCWGYGLAEPVMLDD